MARKMLRFCHQRCGWRRSYCIFIVALTGCCILLVSQLGSKVPAPEVTPRIMPALWSEATSTMTSKMTTEMTLPKRTLFRRLLSHVPRAEGRCANREKHTNIVFIKVHKAGSTTVSNLLARYALNHDLNIALPEQRPAGDIFHCFGPFSPEKVLPVADSQQYNVLFNHMVYNRPALDTVMPADSFYLAIMREPVARFLSSAYYFRLLKPPAENNTDNAAFKAFISEGSRVKLEQDMRVYNSIVRDSGLPVALHKNATAVSRHIETLERELDLMLVMEHFLESLLLLKRRACLSLQDVLFIQTNTRKSYKVHNITTQDLHQLRQWQSADHAVYDHFYAKFWELIRAERAEGFEEELNHFRTVTVNVSAYCSSNATQWDTLVVKTSSWNQEFTVNARDCQLMNMDERDFQRLLLTRAQERRARGGYQEKRKTIPQWRPQC